MIKGIFGLARNKEFTESSDLAHLYGKWSGIRTNHVVDKNGNFFGADGSSRSISNEQDRKLLIALRSAADLVGVDAATARTEQYKSLQSGTPLAIFSRTGNFESIPAVEAPSSQVFLFSPVPYKPPKSNKNLNMVRLEGEFLDEFLAWSKKLGLRSLLLETGPTLTKLFHRAKLVSESALTITGEPSDSTTESVQNPFDSNAELASMAKSEDGLFTLWRH